MQHQVGGSMSGNKVRVYEVAKQLNLDPKAVVGLFQAIGIADVRNHMSSVEPEAVERVKRHLEKQRTHDVVEEKVRPGVVKRRAIAKPGAAAPPSSTSLPVAAPSSRHLDDSADSMRVAPSSAHNLVEQNGHGSDVAIARDRESGRMPSVRELPEERKSTRDVVEIPPAPPSVPRDRKSARALEQEAPAPVSEVAAAPSAERVVEQQAPAPTPPPVAYDEPAPAPASERVAARSESDAPQTSVSEAPAPQRPSAAPKTGVEYWTGRPGVPMPAQTGMTRTTTPTQGNMPRRVQYDPRAGSTSGPGRGGMRAPGQQGGRPMMGGRGGPGARR